MVHFPDRPLEQHHAERHHEWVENQAPSGRLPRPALRELWRFRALAIVLALRDLKVRYKQTASASPGSHPAASF